MWRLVSKGILGAAPRKAAASSLELRVLPRFYQGRVDYRCNNPPNLVPAVGTGSVEAPARLRKYDETEDVSADNEYIASKPELEFCQKDLLTEESLWGLYERWMKHCKITRSPDEIHERFDAFKDTIRDVRNLNFVKDEPECPCRLDVFADTIKDDPSIKCDPFGCEYALEDDEDDEDGYIVFRPEHGFDEKGNLLTEESLWSLYESKMKYYRITRSPDEMCKQFDEFKAVVRDAHNFQVNTG